MWRNLAKIASYKTLKPSSTSSNHSHFIHKLSLLNSPNPLRQIALNDGFLPKSIDSLCRSFGTAAMRVVSSTDESDSDELQELFEQHRKQQEEVKTVGGISVGKYHLLKRRQIKMETEAWENAAEEYQELLEDMCEKKLAPNLPFVKSLFLGWFEPLRDAIEREQQRCLGSKRNVLNHAPYFNELPAHMMAVITMHKLMALLMSSNGGNGTVRVIQAAIAVGDGIETEARIQGFLEKTKKKKVSKAKENECKSDEVVVEEEQKDFDQTSKQQQRLRDRVASLIGKRRHFEANKIIKSFGDTAPWGQDVQVKVGCMLLQLLIETAYIQPPMDQLGDNPPDIRPAFMHTFKNVLNDALKTCRRYGVIQCDALVCKGLEKSARHMVIPYMPMLVPPVNWTGYDRGAYLFLPSFVMRTHGAKQQRDVVKKTSREQLEHVFEALDTLGSTRWRINKKVLTVVDRIWASGGCLAGLVDRKDLPEPEQPDTEDEKELRNWKWKAKNVRKENGERHSQRCDVELKLSVARKMKDEEGFYYPHNLDFRGRAYPMHPHLNHLGSDLCRGILEFSEGRPLGKSGLHWLKIHLANVYGGGVDKLSHEGRTEFAERHLDEIFDSADRPLEGKRWWLGAEDPFQCLATCYNLAEALRSSNPEETLSYLPIHQDGSCNGLQHYAALGRDKIGAAAVNLVAGEKPADVYSGIAARVHDIMRRDAQLDPTDSTAKHAKLLVDQVDRKLVKQTVMTSVYGVTFIGARDQIKRRLKERNSIPDDQELYAAACYAAKTTMTALQEMFEGARSIMAWLGDCAQVIAKDNRKPVQWITPIGLPVVQPYKQLGRHLVKTSLQILALQRETNLVMVKRQRTAFPPNFVHSLDGSHMMMTAIACKKAGLNFAGVHDSYWTHACDVDEMNKILREKFVELYEAPILENLLESFQKQFPKSKFPPLPSRGEFDLKEVLESPYFFN